MELGAPAPSGAGCTVYHGGINMKVRATQLGYYNHRRRFEGDIFDLEVLTIKRQDKDGKFKEIRLTPEQQFSPKWMEKIETDQVERPKKKSSVQEQTPSGGL